MKKLINAFQCAIAGFFSALRSEQNLRIHLVAFASMLAVAYWLELEYHELLVILLCSALVISLELINAALETLANRVTKAQDPLIKRTKDIAAAAVLVAALFSLAIGIIIIARHL